ncbi:MAG TPA: hypothetical protein VGL86_11325, partial [Polyangia bacterium]
MRAFAFIVIASLVLATSTADPSFGAGDGRPLLRRGIELYREASYAESVAMLEHARTRGGLEPAERVECSFYLAAGYVALSSTGAARRELRAVLQDEPDYELPQYTSPKVAALFREVKDELENAPRLRALPPERRGDVLALRFEASRTGGRAFGVVEWRWRGESGWREAPLYHDGRDGELLHADLTLERAGALEYWAEGRAAAGALSAGSAAAPLELPVVSAPRLALVAAGPPPPSRARRLWWVWTGIGAVGAAGLGV